MSREQRAPRKRAHRHGIARGGGWLILIVALGLSFVACGMHVGVYKTPAGLAATPLAEGCPVRFLKPEAPGLEACDERAEVELGDTGFSSSCGTGDARRHLRRLACEVGGDTVTTTTDNSAMSPCIFMRARILACPAPDEPDEAADAADLPATAGTSEASDLPTTEATEDAGDAPATN